MTLLRELKSKEENMKIWLDSGELVNTIEALGCDRACSGFYTRIHNDFLREPELIEKYCDQYFLEYIAFECKSNYIMIN